MNKGFNLEKSCIGFLIGVLLFYVYNKIFLIEGVEMTFCAQGKNQNCPDGTPCDDIRNCENSDACICPSGGESDGKIPLKPILNPSKFLSDVNKSFNDTSSNGVMVSMNVLNNDIVNVDGSTTILRIDSSWNIWFIPCYNGIPRARSSDYQCCNDNIKNAKNICRMSVGFGWIWDPVNLPQVECAYVQDAATIYFGGDHINRCDGKNPTPFICNPNKNDCINSMLEAASKEDGLFQCPENINYDKCPLENEVIIMKNVGKDGQPIRKISGNLVPSALVFVYDPNIFGFYGTNRNGSMLQKTFLNEDGSREKTYDALLNTLDENTYVVIMESLKLKSEYGNPQPRRISPRFVEIVKLTELENHFK